MHAVCMAAGLATARAYFETGAQVIVTDYSAMRVAAAATAGMHAGHRYARANGIERPTSEVVMACCDAAASLVSLRRGPQETSAALRIQALVRGGMVRSFAKRHKAAQLRFAKLRTFDFIQAIIDVWEEARLSTEEKLVSMFMLGDKNDDGVLDYPEFQPLLREFAASMGSLPVSEGRSRVMYMKMVQAEDAGAISIDTFVQCMADFANEYRAELAGKVTRSTLLTAGVAISSVAPNNTRQRRAPKAERPAMMSLAEDIAEGDEEEDDDTVNDEAGGRESPVQVVDEHTVLDPIPEPPRRVSVPKYPQSDRQANRQPKTAAVELTAMSFPQGGPPRGTPGRGAGASGSRKFS